MLGNKPIGSVILRSEKENEIINKIVHDSTDLNKYLAGYTNNILNKSNLFRDLWAMYYQESPMLTKDYMNGPADIISYSMVHHDLISKILEEPQTQRIRWYTQGDTVFAALAAYAALYRCMMYINRFAKHTDSINKAVEQKIQSMMQDRVDEQPETRNDKDTETQDHDELSDSETESCEMPQQQQEEEEKDDDRDDNEHSSEDKIENEGGEEENDNSCANAPDTEDDDNDDENNTDTDESLSSYLLPEVSTITRHIAQAMADEVTAQTHELKKLADQSEVSFEDMMSSSYKNTYASQNNEFFTKLQNGKLNTILRLVGRLKECVTNRVRSSWSSRPVESVDITVGQELMNILPAEMALLKGPNMRKLDLLRRLNEGGALSYEKVSINPVGDGPIVLCVDTSSSMLTVPTTGEHQMETPTHRLGKLKENPLERKREAPLDEHTMIQKLTRMQWASALSSAIVNVAKNKRRRICVLTFGEDVRNRWTADHTSQSGDYAKIQAHCMSLRAYGATQFSPILMEAMGIIETAPKFKKADIIFITDGEASIEPGDIEHINKVRREKHVRIWTWDISQIKDNVIRDDTYGMPEVSDAYWRDIPTSLSDEGLTSMGKFLDNLVYTHRKEKKI